MKPDRMKTTVLPLVGLVVALGLAFGGQALLGAEVRYNAQYFVTSFIFAVMPLTALFTSLLCTGVLLGLFWYVMRQSVRSQLVAVVYLVVGLVGATYYMLPFWTARVGLALIPPPPFWAADVVAPGSAFTYTTGATAMAGLLMLVLP